MKVSAQVSVQESCYNPKDVADTGHFDLSLKYNVSDENAMYRNLVSIKSTEVGIANQLHCVCSDYKDESAGMHHEDNRDVLKRWQAQDHMADQLHTASRLSVSPAGSCRSVTSTGNVQGPMRKHLTDVLLFSRASSTA